MGHQNYKVEEWTKNIRKKLFFLQIESWMKLFQFKVSLNVFPSFRSRTQYLIFIYVNNNKGGTKTSFETEFYRNWVSKNLDWIASKSFDARMKGFIETSKIFLSFLLCSQGILICSCFAAATVKSEKFYLHFKVLSSRGIYFLNELKLSMINDTLEYKLLRDWFECRCGK